MSEKSSRGGRPSKRNFILKAAEELVREQGAAQLTFDRLSEQTGISKGGLLYHFASKDELILAMMIRMIDTREECRKELSKEMEGPDAEVKALILSQVDMQSYGGSQRAQDEMAMDSAVLCAASTNRELLAPLRGRWREKMEEFDKTEMGGDKARIAFFAGVGERLMQQLGMIDSNSEERERFVRAIRNFIDS